MEKQKKNVKAVYTIVSRENDRDRWVQVGIGFVNRDSSITVRLDANPVNGVLQIRDFKPRQPAGRAA